MTTSSSPQQRYHVIQDDGEDDAEVFPDNTNHHVVLRQNSSRPLSRRTSSQSESAFEIHDNDDDNVDDNGDPNPSDDDEGYVRTSANNSIHADSNNHTMMDLYDELIRDKQRLWAVALFATCTVLLFADQNLMSPNLSAIARDFNFTDIERDTKLGGDIALAFWVLGAPASLIVGCLGDSPTIIDRTRLFAITVGIGESACLGTYFARTYPQLYICRAITGFSLGGALPLIYSICADLFVAELRHTVSAGVSIGSGIGISLGQGVAGYLGPTFGWRLPFLIISIPALACAALVYWTVPDPERGGMEYAVRQHKQQRQQQQQQQEREEENHHHNEQQEQEQQQRRTSSPTISSIEIIPLDRNSRQHDPIVNDMRDAIGNDRVCGIRASRSSLSPVVSEPVQIGVLTSAANVDDDLETDHDLSSFILPSSSSSSPPPSSNLESSLHSHWYTFRILCTTPTVVLTMLQGAPGCVPWGIVNTYLNDYLSENRNMSVEYATSVVLIFGLGGFLGMVGGGTGGSYLYANYDKRYPVVLAGGSALLACIPFWILLNYVDDTTSFIIIAFVAITSGLFACATGPIVKATLQNVTLPETRGQAFALYNTFDDFGRGLGPVFIAKLVSALGGRTPAFNVGVFGWVLCGIFNLVMYWTVGRDEDRVQTTLSARLTKTANDIHVLDGCDDSKAFAVMINSGMSNR